MALLTIFKWIANDGSYAQHLIFALARASSREVTHTVSNVIQLWLDYAESRDQPDEDVDELPAMGLSNGHGDLGCPSNDITYQCNMPTDPVLLSDEFYEDAKATLFSGIKSRQSGTLPRNDTALVNIASFIAAAAQRSNKTRGDLVDSGALALVLIALADGIPILSEVLCAFQQSKVTRKVKGPFDISAGRQIGFAPRVQVTEAKAIETRCLPLTLIDTEAQKLLKEVAFEGQLRTSLFASRRRICHPLLNALLGPYTGSGGLHAEIREVLVDILSPPERLFSLDFKFDTRKSSSISPSSSALSSPSSPTGRNSSFK